MLLGLFGACESVLEPNLSKAEEACWGVLHELVGLSRQAICSWCPYEHGCILLKNEVYK